MIPDLLDFIHRTCKLHVVLGVELEFYMVCDSETDVLKVLSNSCKYPIVKETEEYQYEIRTEPQRDIIGLLSNLVWMKEFIVNSEGKWGYQAFFDAKPFQDKAGSAMHINITLVDSDGRNQFVYANGMPNKVLSYAIGGLCKTMLQSMDVFAPNQSSYARFGNPDIHTPTTVSWGRNNRSAAIRIPVNGPIRIEQRVPCADADPFFVVNEILGGIALGLYKKIDPPTQVYGIASDAYYNLEKLPLSLEEANLTAKAWTDSLDFIKITN